MKMIILGAFENDQDLFALSLFALTIKVITVAMKNAKNTVITGDTTILKTIAKASQLSAAPLPLFFSSVITVAFSDAFENILFVN